MKKVLLITMMAIAFSCSKDDANCDDAINEINSRYDSQVEWVKENTNPIDYNQIGLLNEERRKKLDEACN